MSATNAALPVVRDPYLLVEVRRQTLRERYAAFRAPGVHPNLVEVKDAIKQANVPVRGAARADVTQDLAVRTGEMLRAEGGHGAGPHVGDRAGIDHREWHAAARIEQVEQRHLRRQVLLVVVDIVTDDLDAGEPQRGDVAAKHVEVAVESWIGNKVHARLDHRLAAALRQKAGLDRRHDLAVGHGQRLHVEAIEVVQEERFQRRSVVRVEVGHGCRAGPQLNATSASDSDSIKVALIQERSADLSRMPPNAQRSDSRMRRLNQLVRPRFEAALRRGSESGERLLGRQARDCALRGATSCQLLGTSKAVVE